MDFTTDYQDSAQSVKIALSVFHKKSFGLPEIFRVLKDLGNLIKTFLLFKGSLGFYKVIGHLSSVCSGKKSRGGESLGIPHICHLAFLVEELHTLCLCCLWRKK